jgi:hypothetical protein
VFWCLGGGNVLPQNAQKYLSGARERFREIFNPLQRFPSVVMRSVP